jgi:hypothetical protein
MNDILPKPFTKEGLLGMLEVFFFFFPVKTLTLAADFSGVNQKHLDHLKQFNKLADGPRSLGYSEGQIQEALNSTAASAVTLINGQQQHVAQEPGPSSTCPSGTPGAFQPVGGLPHPDYFHVMQSMNAGDPGGGSMNVKREHEEMDSDQTAHVKRGRRST